MRLTENQLDEWVRGNARDAQAVIVELVWRLVAASSPRPKERRFPLGDSIGQHGPDGVLDVDYPFAPFVPEGRSFWEIGTGLKAADKATADYSGLVSGIPETVRLQSTFVFVTPLSGRRDWEHTWKEDAQGAWLEARRAKGEWRGVQVIDGTKLVDWVHQFPSVELWLVQRINGIPVQQIETPEQRWSLLRGIGEPPPLAPKVFLENRDEAIAKIKEVFAGTAVQLKLDTRFPDQVVDFVCAALADLDDESRADAFGRCLVISGPDAWSSMVAQREKHVLIADSSLDLSGEFGTKLIQKARRAGHAVIFGGAAGGIPDPTSVVLPAPRIHELSDALEKCGYSEERARTLAQKSGGNLGSLLRCLQNLSLMPEWAESTAAADLAVAAVLGSWVESSDADRMVVERLSGNGYGEWIGKIREAALRPGTPLTLRDGVWRFLGRYEGWYALGSKIYDEHLDRLQTALVSVLTEKDPQFELPPEERCASSIHGKVLAHSRVLRNGLAESLALVGSHPKALTSCTLGKAEVTAALVVREVLSGVDWERWASLNDLLPLLAESAPGEFLDAVETALVTDPCPFDEVFAQEGDGFMGRTYMSGLLWALETLAWSPEHLSRVVICLGELAARDPGGRWSNRPANSLTTILLPWMPQTCAPIATRGAAVSALLAEIPDVGWRLLVSLLPNSHSTSSGTRRPAWREMIPDDWSKGVTNGEYWEQSELYANMAIVAAKSDRIKLADLIDHMEDLPPSAQEQLLAHLGSDALVTMPESDRLDLWTELVDLVTKHRKFSQAEWAMTSQQIEKIVAIADRLAPDAPMFRHQRLFSEREFDLYEENGNYEEQRNGLEARRRTAVEEIAANGGTQAVLGFAVTVQSAWRVGVAFGDVARDTVDEEVLPDLLDAEHRAHAQFAGGFVWSRFRHRGWKWVDGIDTSGWTREQIAQFLAFLPFEPYTWDRSNRLLGADEALYWRTTNANPYETEASLERAVDPLIQCGRPNAALRCLNRMLHDKQRFNVAQVVRALMAALGSSEGAHSMDTYQTVEIIKALQETPGVSPDDLFRVEWAYLPLLDRHNGASPKFLWHRLATEPRFFCEVIRLVFHSRKEERPTEEPTEERKRIASNAYRLLSEWRTPPGCRADGSYDGGALNQWLAEVKMECSETGHLEVAMTMLGHSLIHVPADPDGLWIHRSAAAVLNARDATDMRDGFRMELFNSRGVHGFTSGRAERDLAAKYLGKADDIEAAGFHRVATTLRELAAGYDREAERDARRDPFDD